MLSLLTKPALAQVSIKDKFPPASNFPTISQLINVILPNLLVLAGVIGFLFVVIAGIGIISSAGSGEAEKVSKGKQAFTAAVVGLIIIFSAYFIINIVETLTGLSIFSPNM